MVGVSFDSVEENASFAEKFSFGYPLLCDTDRSLGMAYGACASPDASTPKRISYLIDANGVVLQAYANVDAKNHPQQVLEDLG